MARFRLLLAASLVAGLMLVPAAAGASSKCDGQIVGPVVHEVEETIEGVTGKNAVTDLLHDEVEPFACDELP